LTTESGGEVAVPSAVRNGDSTTTMGLKEVIVTRIDAASDSTRPKRDKLDDARSARRRRPQLKLMLISCAASGVAELISAAIEPATALIRCGGPNVRQVLPPGRPNKLAISCSRLS